MELFGPPRPTEWDNNGILVPALQRGLRVMIRSTNARGQTVLLDHDEGNPANLHINRLAWGYKQPKSSTRTARRK
jgi:hypothetical protein